ncbi:hypothetical protein ADS78_05590 [Idiomarina abyssalis]|nr:hypothetical protein ADS78_05590 [Idiomarina abyssalis]
MLDFIYSCVSRSCGDFESFVDIFSGTGAVASRFNSNYKVVTNDILYSNYLSNFAFLGDSPLDLRKLNNILAELNSLPDCEDNYFSSEFAGKYFNTKNSRKIGAIREYITNLKSLKERERAYLITSLIYSADKIAHTCGHYDAYRSGVEEQPELKLKHLSLSNDLNRGNECFHQDANTLVKNHKFCRQSVLYADPPYNSRQYGSAYHVLENLASWKKPDLEGKARKPKDRKLLSSRYSTKEAIAAFEELIETCDARYVVLSYSNMGTKGNPRSNAKMSDSEIVALMKRYGKLKVETTNHKAFTTGKSKINSHEERLFILDRA